MQKAKAPTKGLSELNSMAFGFAVYASWSELTQYHAKLASSCWSGSTGRDFHPQGSDERFQSCRLHLIPLSQALLGAIASSAAVLFQSQLASVNTTSAGNGNMLARFEGALLSALEKAKRLPKSRLTSRPRDGIDGQHAHMYTPRARNCRFSVQ